MARRGARGIGLEGLGEFGLIELVRRRVGAVGGAWLAGIGDDAAVLRPPAGRDLVWTADALVEDVHFRWRTTDARSLGHKALAVNLSDLNAMGAEPLGFLLSLGLPPRTEPGRLDRFLRGLLAEARAHCCPLVGGDTVSAPVWSLSISAVGSVPRGRALARGGGRPGDRLMVTGTLGGSALGLALLERRAVSAGAAPGGGTRSGGDAAFVRRHLRPRPPLGAGPRLARMGLARAAVDLSDGLASDLARILEAGGGGADVELDALPLARGLRARAAELGLSPEALALAGGEDYELLFAVRARAPQADVFARRLGCPVTEIGGLRRGRGVRYTRGGEPVRVEVSGYDHFKTRGKRSEQ